MKRITLIITLMWLFVTALPLAAEEGGQQNCQAQHKVVAGDTLFKLGQKYGVDWRQILYANGLRDVMNLEIGKVLCIPAVLGVPPAPKTPTPTVTATAPATATPALRIPLITITSVVPGKSVTIKGTNFLPNDSYDVFMNTMGTRGVSGVSVGKTNSGTGSFTATYTLPAKFAKEKQIAIRLQSPVTHYYSYNWFWNN